MSATFSLQALPAREGDALILTYGDKCGIHRILIDFGPKRAFEDLLLQLTRLTPAERQFELMVVTHVDTDHIDGAIKLLNQDVPGLAFRDLWFNGWPQLQKLNAVRRSHASELRGAGQGGYLAARIGAAVQPWNVAHSGMPVVIRDGPQPLPTFSVPGGLKLTILSPTVPQLQALRDEWIRTYSKRNMDPDDQSAIAAELGSKAAYRARAPGKLAMPAEGSALDGDTARLDTAVANGSSIAFIAEYAGMRCALLADAHAPTLAQSLSRLATERRERRLRIDLMKLSHHGSRGNITREILESVDCQNFLVSSDGSKFSHPDPEAIDLVVRSAAPAALYFNYVSDQTRPWADCTRQAELGFRAVYPEAAESGVTVDITQLASCRS